MIKKYGYLSHTFSRTFDKYDHVDCFSYMNIHDVLKLYKHGYSKVTDHATREIRHGRITRNQGLSLVKKFELKKYDYKEKFCEWLNMTEESLDFVMDQNRNSLFWEKIDNNKWLFKGLSTLQKYNKVNTNKFEKSYISNNNDQFYEKYITIGKGYKSNL